MGRERREGKRGWKKAGGSSSTRVDERTVFRRGKSEIPASRIEIEESRRERELRSDVTDALSEARDCEVIIAYVFVRSWRCAGIEVGLKVWDVLSRWMVDVNIWMW